MPNKNQLTLQNPYDLSYTFSFDLRLLSSSVVEKLDQDLKPKRLLATERLSEDQRLGDISEITANLDDSNIGAKSVDKSGLGLETEASIAKKLELVKA